MGGLDLSKEIDFCRKEAIRYLLWEAGNSQLAGVQRPIHGPCQQSVETGRMGLAYVLAFPLRASLCEDLGWGEGQRHPDGLWKRKRESTSVHVR